MIQQLVDRGINLIELDNLLKDFQSKLRYKVQCSYRYSKVLCTSYIAVLKYLIDNENIIDVNEYALDIMYVFVEDIKTWDEEKVFKAFEVTGYGRSITTWVEAYRETDKEIRDKILWKAVDSSEFDFIVYSVLAKDFDFFDRFPQRNQRILSDIEGKLLAHCLVFREDKIHELIMNCYLDNIKNKKDLKNFYIHWILTCFKQGWFIEEINYDFEKAQITDEDLVKLVKVQADMDETGIKMLFCPKLVLTLYNKESVITILKISRIFELDTYLEFGEYAYNRFDRELYKKLVALEITAKDLNVDQKFADSIMKYDSSKILPSVFNTYAAKFYEDLFRLDIFEKYYLKMSIEDYDKLLDSVAYKVNKIIEDVIYLVRLTGLQPKKIKKIYKNEFVELYKSGKVFELEFCKIISR